MVGAALRWGSARWPPLVCSIAVVTLAATWLLNSGLSGNHQLYARAPSGPGTLALASADPGLIQSADRTFESKWAAASGLPSTPLLPQRLRDYADNVPSPPPRPVIVAQSTPKPVPERADNVPLPRPHPAMPEVARAPVERAPQVAAVAPPSPPPAVAEKRVAPREAHNRALALPEVDDRTAVYDISARMVYLPNGQKLEAHSGLYDKLDDPRYVNVKMRGPTPPNVYQLTLREQLFHGVRAIRLNPVDESKMFGRAGMLAHTYMLGPNGDSNGCVSFKDYNKFLRAFLDGEVKRLVVVPNLTNEPLRLARSTPASEGRYAANNPVPFDKADW